MLNGKALLINILCSSLFIQQLHAHILRLPCLTYGNFSIVANESRLTSNVLETFNDLSEDECEENCLNHRLCKSINMKTSTGVNCELNSKSTEDPFDDVISTESPGWTYKTTDFNAKNVSDFEFLFLGFRYRQGHGSTGAKGRQCPLPCSKGSRRQRCIYYPV